MSAVVHLLEKDDTCGFDSPQVKAEQRVEGEPGQGGVVIRTVEDCDVDIMRSQERSPLIFGCDGRGEVSGSLRVSAERRLVGLITDSEDPDQRVIPVGPESLSFEITHADMFELMMKKRGEPEHMIVHEGILSGTVGLRLARDQDGFCGAPTRNIGFKDVNFSRATITVNFPDHDYKAIVQGTNLNGVRGEYSDQSNVLQGEVAINGVRQKIPVSLDELAMDPAYDPETFQESYVCEDNTQLALPFSADCGAGGAVGAEAFSENIGRLTVNGFAKIAEKIGEDASCGFASATVKEKAAPFTGPGGESIMLFTVEQCAIELAPDSTIATDCNGTQTRASGRVIVSARKYVEGLTSSGTSGERVVPLTDDAATIEVTEMRFENFELVDGENTIHWNDGILRGKLTPRLAFDDADGACSFATGNVHFENLVYENSSVVISGAAGRFELTIDNSNLLATSGEWNGAENMLGGTISLSGQKYEIPVGSALDPNYQRDTYARSWQCGTLQVPVSYDCSISDQFGDGAARFGIAVLGGIAELINNDTTCGFESPAVKTSAQTTGTLGRPGGAALFTAGGATPCRFSWTMPTQIDSDCNGKRTMVQGTVNVRATKRLEGWLTGDENEPIVPDRRDPVAIELELDLQDFTMFNDGTASNLIVRSGRLRGTLKPRAAIAVDREACAIGTPVVTFENVAWQDATISASDQANLEIQVSSAALTAQSGAKDSIENTLSGTIVVDGQTLTVPFNPSAGGLDPNYDRGVFDRSYQSCNPNLRVAVQESDCDLKPKLAKEAARALIFAGATMTSMVVKDADCGFSDSGVQENPVRVTGDDGDFGSMDFAINNCRIQRGSTSANDAAGNVYDNAQRISQDCRSRGLYAKGRITVAAREHVEGRRDSIWFTDVIYPLNPSSVTIYLDSVLVEEFTVFTRDPNLSPLSKVTIHSGNLTGTVYPKTGEDQDERGYYTIATPVAALESLTLSNGEITLIDEEGKNFKLSIATSELDAYNGMYNNDGNRIAGSITVDGQSFTVARESLEASYNQADFDQRYACTSNLVSTLPPNATLGR